MIYQVTDILRDVRVALDQNNVSTPLVAEWEVDTLSLEEVIRSKIEDATRRVERHAPAAFLEEGHTFGDAVYWGDHDSGWVLLPDDFMRLIAFRMSDWERTVYNPISADDPRYGRQSSRYKGIRGNVQKPVCALVNRPEGKALEFYSCNNKSATVERGSYLPYPRIDGDDGIDICERCYEAVVYMTAALVAATYGENEKSTNLMNLSTSIFE